MYNVYNKLFKNLFHLRLNHTFSTSVTKKQRKGNQLLKTNSVSKYTSNWFSQLIPMQNNAKQFHEQNFDYFLILDFEATCDSPRQIYPMEIIEFPVLKINAKTFEVEDEFHRYVRPTINPILSPFCTQLTGIIQEMVDDSDRFYQVVNKFEDWLQQNKLIDEKQNPLVRFTFITCGDWDLKKILPLQCRLVGYEIPKYMTHWINVKKSFTDQVRHWPKSQAYLVEYFGITAIGRAHSGIDDCYNLAAIVREIAKLGHVYHNTSQYKN